jgi:hypothetical protein
MGIQLRNVVAGLISAMVIAPIAAKADLVQDGGFETGLFSDWICFNAEVCGTTSAFNRVHSGSRAFFGYDNSGVDGTLLQFIVTTPGASYNFSAWSMVATDNLNVDDPTLGSVLKYSLDGAAPVGIPATTTYLNTTASFVATSNLTEIGFSFHANPSIGFWLIDDVSVTPVASVPGPVVGAGLPGLVMAFGAFLAWRRRKAALAA